METLKTLFLTTSMVEVLEEAILDLKTPHMLLLGFIMMDMPITLILMIFAS